MSGWSEMIQIFDAAKMITGVAMGILLGSIYYNGVPVLKDIPFIGAAFEGQARKDLVPEFQVLALRAELNQLQSTKRANDLVIDAYQLQLRNVRAAEAARIEQTEQEIAGYEKRLADAGRVCLLDHDDIKFLRQ